MYFYYYYHIYMIPLEVDTWISKLIQASTVKKIRKFLIFDSPEVIPNAQLVTCFFWEGVGAEHVCFMMHNLTGPTTTGGPGGHAHPHPFFFFVAKKIGKKGKKERVSKQKLLKGYHQGQNVTVLAILERLEFKNFSCRPIFLFSVPWPLHCEIDFAGPV